MAGDQKALRKRQKIQQSNKMIFIWVAVSSVVVSFSLVGAYFVATQILFTSKLNDEKGKTLSALTESQTNVVTLKEELYKLRANTNLKLVAQKSQEPIEVIFDALPADANTLALGASLEDVIVAGVSDVRLQSVSVESVSEGEATETGQMVFNMKMSSRSANSLSDVLERMERSIRVFDIKSFVLAKAGEEFELTIEAVAYYEPAVEVKLDSKVVKP